MWSKRIRIVLAALLMAGCTFLPGAVGPGADTVAGGGFRPPAARFRVVVITPGAAQKRASAGGADSQSAKGSLSGVQPLPNYREETLTLGLLEQ